MTLSEMRKRQAKFLREKSNKINLDELNKAIRASNIRYGYSNGTIVEMLREKFPDKKFVPNCGTENIWIDSVKCYFPLDAYKNKYLDICLNDHKGNNLY